MPTTTTVTTYTAAEKAAKARRNYNLVACNLDRWKDEARAAGDYQQLADLQIDTRYSKDYWAGIYHIYAVAELRERAAAATDPDGGTMDHPQSVAALDVLCDVLELLDPKRPQTRRALMDYVRQSWEAVHEAEEVKDLAEA